MQVFLSVVSQSERRLAKLDASSELLPQSLARVQLSHRFRGELSELHASFKLCPTKVFRVYSTKVKGGLAELDASSKFCPQSLTRVHLIGNLRES